MAYTPHELAVGDHVRDCFGDEGIVVKIKEGWNDEDHGTVTVWQMNRLDYGADNCEHYPHFGWPGILTVVHRANQEEIERLEQALFAANL
jgi:hypothetical protein